MTSEPVLVDLALQGGGAHGAFTWGVLDRLRTGIRTLGGALIGVTTVGSLLDTLVDRSTSAADAIGKTADKVGVGV
jgi:predicted patatin/cPLA2 family phospholipase